MQKSVLIIFVILFSVKSYSQEFSGGILLGVSGNQVDGDEQGGYKKPGLILGAFIMKPLSDKGAIKIETYYIGKGAVLNVEYPDGSFFQEFNTSLHYIEMPFLYNFQFHPKIDLSIGIAPSYLFAHKLTRAYQEIGKNSYSLKTFDFQPMGQLGFYLTDRIFSNIRISHSVFSIRNEYNATWYNSNLSIVLRYTFE